MKTINVKSVTIDLEGFSEDEEKSILSFGYARKISTPFSFDTDIDINTGSDRFATISENGDAHLILRISKKFNNLSLYTVNDCVEEELAQKLLDSLIPEDYMEGAVETFKDHIYGTDDLTEKDRIRSIHHSSITASLDNSLKKIFFNTILPRDAFLRPLAGILRNVEYVSKYDAHLHL